MDWKLTTQIAGSSLLAAGLIINFIISKRKFNRRTITGSEVFKNYGRSKLIPFTERFGRLIAWILVLGGAFLIIIALT